MQCTLHSREMMKLGSKEVCAECLSIAGANARQVWTDLTDRQVSTALQARLIDAAVPEEFQRKTFSNFVAETDRAAKVVEFLGTYCSAFDMWRHKRKGFLLIGPPGTAKSHLACAMVRSIIDGGHRAGYISLPRLTREIRAAFSRPRGVEDLYRKLIAMDFLVVDEIDLHGTSDNDYNMLYDIINSRYEKAGSPTLAISNRSLEHLQSDLDERVVSRILAGTLPIMCDWPSRRDTRRAMGLTA